jgi:O-antigen ligase
MTTAPTLERTERPPITMRPASVALFFVGLAVPLHIYLEVTVLRWPATLVVSGFVSLLGWRTLLLTRSVKRYMFWAIMLSSWILISTAVAWTPIAFYNARIVLVWLVVIVPGLSVVLRDDGRRRALIAGFTIGVGFLLLVALSRMLRGLPVMDAPVTGASAAAGDELFGTNRNIVNGVVVFVFAFLLANALPPRIRWLRWPILAASVVYIPVSGGRAGLIGLVVVPLVYALVQPGGSRRLRMLYIGLLAVAAFAFAIQEIGGSAGASSNRLLGAIQGERTSTDDTRELLLRKGWHLADDHSWFGVGLGMFAETHHPVVDEGATREIRAAASRHLAHNTYVGFMAETGFPGFILFCVLLISLVRSGLRHRADPDVRACVTALIASMVMMGTDVLNRPILFLPMALLLATVSSDEIANA